MNLKTIIIWVAAGLAGPACAPPAAAVGSPLAEAREYVMGTIVELRVYAASTPEAARAALETALAEIRTVDRLMAVQRPDSDLSRLNREGARGPVGVDRRVVTVIAASLDASRLSDGAFDVTVLPVVRAWGFTDGHPHRPDDPASVPRPAGYRTIVVDAGASTVAFTDPATQVDLGGIAKGFALDQARDLMRRAGVRSAWLDLGGQIATVGMPPDGGHWRIALEHPRRDDEPLGVIEVDEASVSTSADREQFVEAGGRRSSHVIDPRTGAPAEGLVSATVVHGSAMQADALSTAAAVGDLRTATALLARAGVGGVLVARRSDGTLDVHVTPGVRYAPARNDKRKYPS
jgi:thiamine biosynthesis lipoprotein